MILNIRRTLLFLIFDGVSSGERMKREIRAIWVWDILRVRFSLIRFGLFIGVIR